MCTNAPQNISLEHFAYLGTKYVVVNENMQALLKQNPIKLTLYQKIEPENIYIYEIPNSPSYTQFFSSAEVVDEYLAKQYATSKFNNNILFLEQKDKNDKILQNQTSKALIQIIDNKSGSLEININNEFDGYFLLRENFNNGWKAYVNDNKVQIYYANYLFQAVKISKGKNKIIFKYMPTSLILGTLLSLSGIILFIMFLVKIKKYLIK